MREALNNTFDEMITSVVKPMLSHAGFKKSGSRFFRKRNDIWDVIEFQKSMLNSNKELRYYINVGLKFEGLEPVENSSYPKMLDCDIQVRIDDCVPESGPHYNIESATQIGVFCGIQSQHLKVLLGILDNVGDIEAGVDLLHRRHVDAARIHYRMGDDEKARARLSAAVATVPNATEETFADFARNLGLTRLVTP